ncbi:MAG: TAXI family TRAP transporter solute-binding subunit [Pseudomonadota bacterium]
MGVPEKRFIVRVVVWISVVVAMVNLFTHHLCAQTQEPVDAPFLQLKPVAHKNIVAIMSGNSDGGSLNTIYDIATVLERTSDIRIIPVVGNGSLQNIKDILNLDNIDAVIIQPHILWHLKETGEVAPDIDKRIAYITTLFTDELHVIARKEIKDFKDLAGKRVNFSIKGSGTRISMGLIFNALQMKVQEFNMRQADAFELMKQGQLDATSCICSKPLYHAYMLKNKSKDFKILSIPYTTELEENFFPGLVSHKDYPDLIPPGGSVNTVAVQTILGIYSGSTEKNERYRRLARFVDAFFNNIKEFKRPLHHEKWAAVNIAASVSGLQRFEPAQIWLNRNLLPAGRQVGAVVNQTTDERIIQSVRRSNVEKADPQPIQAVPSQSLPQ